MSAISSVRSQEYQAKLGFALFLVSLGVFFIASLVAFLVIRFTVGSQRTLPWDSLPWGLAISTLAVIGVSVALHQAVLGVRRERQRRFRVGLGVAILLACVFLLFQGQGLAHLLASHAQDLAKSGGQLHGLMFALVLVHALHVVGGMIALAVVTARASRNAYDHEKYWGVELCAGYWHFLDGVWIAMLAVFLISR
ncbi:MAG: cytochrome c oxidase subunit 3 [Pirellulaceae bacterium]